MPVSIRLLNLFSLSETRYERSGSATNTSYEEPCPVSGEGLSYLGSFRWTSAGTQSEPDRRACGTRLRNGFPAGENLGDARISAPGGEYQAVLPWIKSSGSGL